MSHNLLIRLPNWVGDVCMCLPALDALRASGIRLTCVGGPWACNLLQAYPATVMPLPKGIRDDAKVLRSLSPKEILLFPGSISSAAAAHLASKKAIGYVGDWRRRLLAHHISRDGGEHEVERFWRLAKAAAQYLGLDRSAFAGRIPCPRLPLTDESRRTADRLFGSEADKTIVICPMAAGTINGRLKRWPGFSRAADLLADRGWLLVCCPGPGEQEECRRAVPRANILPGLDLQEYGAVLAAAQGVLANDSGPMHLAAAVGTKVMGVFGVSDPDRYRPWGGHAIADANHWAGPAQVVQSLPTVIDFQPLQTGSAELQRPLQSSYARSTKQSSSRHRTSSRQSIVNRLDLAHTDSSVPN